MKTWEDYKSHVKSIDPESGKAIEDMESLANIIAAMVDRRNSLGISQRELALRTGLSQSSVARIESLSITPNMDTLLKILKQLGLKLTISNSG
ncbi:MAG: helix-turn-helix transcriptional regulator [Youngiibacter sp.]|nr:helix-turn-helix transcriptional regulator [Youngiibacter sp.]